MKLKRKKIAKRRMQLYKNNFGFTEPYKVLIDGTFVKHALDSKVQIFEQIKNYFGAEIKLFTTQCILNELKEIGRPLYGVLVICKNYELYCCGDNGARKARGCLKGIIERGNKDKMIIATKDSNVTNYANTQPGVPILYINGNTILLDKPSESTESKAENASKDKLGLTENEKKVLKQINQENYEREQAERKPKRKKPQQPNPLSCKKKKVINRGDTGSVGKEVESEPAKKRKRKKRIKIAAHAKDTVAAKTKILTES